MTSTANPYDQISSAKEVNDITGENKLDYVRDNIRYGVVFKIIIALIVVGIIFYFITVEQYTAAMITGVAGAMILLIGLDIGSQVSNLTEHEQKIVAMKKQAGLL